MNKIDRRNFITRSGTTLACLVLPASTSQSIMAERWEALMSRRWERPRKLDTFSGVHPRLFLNRRRLERINSQMGASHQLIWEAVVEKADSYLGQPLPLNYESQEDMRALGRGIPWQALVYRLTGDQKYLEGAKKWVLEACRLARWENNRSLAGGECLFGVAVGYDWLYPEWNERERRLIREKLTLQAKAMKDGPPVHHDLWLANHNHVEHCGLAAAGFAVFDEIPEAVEWIRQSDLVFQTFLEFASDDGSSSEGHQYWAYSTEAVLRYLEMARDLLGREYYDNTWLKGAPSFIIFSTLPNFTKENCVMSFGDSHRDYRSHGPTHILYRLAAEYRNQHAQWLAKEMDQRHVGRGDYCTWLNLLWYDETLASSALSTLPTLRNFGDIGWVTSRSGWDEDAIIVGFKCGPMHGHKAQQYYESLFRADGPANYRIQGGHNHPDINSFQVYAYGKWLAIDPQYERPKWTRTHNTLLVNGQGQLGEGKTWFDSEAVLKANASSRLIKCETGESFDYMVGDAENIYPQELGLRKFLRHLVYVKPDVIVLVDELEADRQSDFEWLLHGEQSVEEVRSLSCLVKTDQVGMDVHFLLPKELELRVEEKTVRALCPQVRDTWIVALLHPRRLIDPVSRATLKIEGTGSLSLGVRVRDRNLTVRLDVPEQRVQVSAA